MHIGHGRRFQPFVHILGNFGDEQIIGVLREHTRNIQRHVAVTKHRDFLRVQRPGARVIGVTVIPRDEIGGTIGTIQVDALNGQGRVMNSAGREDNGVVVLAQIGKVQILTVFDIAEESNITAVKHLVQGGNNALNTRVIGRHTVTNQPEGSGVTIKNVDRNLNGSRAYFLRFGDEVSGVNASGACANNSDAQGAGSFRHVFFLSKFAPVHGSGWCGGELSF